MKMFWLLKTVAVVFLLVLPYSALAGKKSACEATFSSADKKLIEATQEMDLGKFISALRQGANINVRGEDGKTALIHAIEARRPDIVDQLIKRAGADPNAPDHEDKTPLMIASLAEDIDSVLTLLDAGADPNRKDKDDRTALIHASLARNKEIIVILHDNGADPGIRDKDGKTALWYMAMPKKKKKKIQQYQRREPVYKQQEEEGVFGEVGKSIGGFIDDIFRF